MDCVSSENASFFIPCCVENVCESTNIPKSCGGHGRMTNVNKIIVYMRLTNELEFKANYYLRNYIHIQSLKRPREYS
jgi:hypothetical protein